MIETEVLLLDEWGAKPKPWVRTGSFMLRPGTRRVTGAELCISLIYVYLITLDICISKVA